MLTMHIMHVLERFDFVHNFEWNHAVKSLDRLFVLFTTYPWSWISFRADST